jgi:hypothetical protein
VRVCLKCGERIPARKLVNGRVRHLQRRKYCLSCSPFGSHNTRNLERVGETVRHVCEKCGKSYIYRKSGIKVGPSTIECGSCAVSSRRVKMRARILKYKGGKCVVCHYSKCNRALIFHHMDMNTKVDNISSMIAHNRSYALIKKEADKCILICNRCHEEYNDGILDLSGYWFVRS